MYILQQNLFSFEEWLKIEEGDRLKLFFSELDLRPYIRMLNASSPQGRKPINREAILRAFLASPQLGIDTFTDFIPSFEERSQIPLSMWLCLRRRSTFGVCLELCFQSNQSQRHCRTTLSGSGPTLQRPGYHQRK